jgi:integrase/recombinase XerD
VNVNIIRHLLKDLGEKAGVTNCHPHRLRHTFVIEYLRNDGDVFKLQMILGHGSLDMVQHYDQMVDDDLLQAHQAHSPIDNLSQRR